MQESTKSIIETGIKEKDAYHVASAIIANYEIILMNPTDFLKILEADKNE